jgi:hypothetical protein
VVTMVIAGSDNLAEWVAASRSGDRRDLAVAARLVALSRLARGQRAGPGAHAGANQSAGDRPLAGC